MDSSPFDSGPQLDIGKLSESDKRELQQVIQGETQKAKIQECRLILPIRLSFLSAEIASFSSTPRTHFPESLRADSYVHSRPQPHGHLLEKVHYREDIWKQAQQWRRDLYTELRGEIPGLEYGRA